MKNEELESMEAETSVGETAQADDNTDNRLTGKEKRLDQRRKIEDLMEKKKMKGYVDDYDYYFEE